jgi:hypothetical protein
VRRRLAERVSQSARLRWMAAATIGCDAVFSYVSTRNLAERFGFGWLSWLFPLCLDATAAVGMELWLSRSPAQRAAKWLALSAIALSLAANMTDWLLAQGNWGSAVLGAVPPAMLAAQLLVLHQHDSQHADRRSTARPRSATGARHGARRPKVSDDVLLTQLRQHELTNGPLTPYQIRTHCHVGQECAARLHRQLRSPLSAVHNGAVVH